MCQSSIYILDSGQHKLLLEEVTRLEIDGDEITVEALFSETVSFGARIKEIDLTRQRIVLERI